MSLSDPLVQQQYCESDIKCPICACKCVLSPLKTTCLDAVT